MTQVSGTVQYVNGPSKFGTFNIKVNNTPYWTGKSAPPVNKGDFVTFTAVQKGNSIYVEEGSLKATASVPSITGATQQLGAGAVYTNGNGDVGRRAGYSNAVTRFNDRPWEPAKEEQRQNSIVMQHSQEMALMFLDLLQRTDALVLPKTAKPAERYEYLENLRKEVTQALYNEASASGDMEAIAAAETKTPPIMPTSWEEN